METYLLVEKAPDGKVGYDQPATGFVIARVIRSYESASRADEDLRLLTEATAPIFDRFFEVINVQHID